MAGEADAVGVDLEHLEFLGVTEMLVDTAAPLGAHRHQLGRGLGHGFGQFGRGAGHRLVAVGPLALDHFAVQAPRLGIVGRRGLGQLVQGEVLRQILAQHADGIGTALATVAHQIGAAGQLVLQFLQLGGVGAALAAEAEGGAVRRIGDQRHDVVEEGAARLDRRVDLQQMLVVDAGDHHRIDLDQDPLGGQALKAFHLALVQDGRRLDPGMAPAVEEDPRIDPGADLGVDHVDGDGDVVDIVIGQGVHMVGHGQTVGRDAELEVGQRLFHRPEGLEGLAPVIHGIAGAGDAQHRKLWHLGRHRQYLARRLLGGQLLAGDAGPRFVGAVVFAITVIALDVAGRRHRHMHAGEIVVGLLAIAGMVLDLVPDMGGQVALVFGRAAGLGGTASGRGGGFRLGNRTRPGNAAQGYDVAGHRRPPHQGMVAGSFAMAMPVAASRKMAEMLDSSAVGSATERRGPDNRATEPCPSGPD